MGELNICIMLMSGGDAENIIYKVIRKDQWRISLIVCQVILIILDMMERDISGLHYSR